MSKTDLTLEIEKALIKRSKNNCERYALEVPIKGGICDFITTKLNFNKHGIPDVSCYEIKVSLNDYYHSENGANFVGDFNYYVMPKELINEIISKQKNDKFMGKGIISYQNGKLRKLSDGRAYQCKMSIEDKFKVMDNMIRLALSNEY